MGMRAHGWKNYQSCHTHGNDTYKSNHLGLVVSMREETLVNDRRRRVILESTMELTLLPPLPPTLTLTLKNLVPLDIPPDPSISMLFPKNPPYHIPNNPF